MSRIILAFLLFLTFGSAHAYDFYFTVYHQAPPVYGSTGHDTEDCVFEKKIIHVKAEDDSEVVMKIKRAYVAYLKNAYPDYLDRIRKRSKFDDPDQILFGRSDVITRGTAAKAREERKDQMQGAKNQGFPVVESDGFNYQP